MFTAALKQQPWEPASSFSAQQPPAPSESLWPEDFHLQIDEMGLFQTQGVPTRQASTSLHHVAPLGQPEQEQREDSRKRLRDAQEGNSLEIFLADLSAQEARREAASQQSSPKGDRDRERSSDSGGDSVETKRRKDKRNHSDNFEKPDPVTAAKTKACRERQRRERLNDSFNELTKTLDHEKPMKAEKTVIIAETIKVLVSLRAENGQFRQHNKLMEERLKESEKEKIELRMKVAMLEHQQSLGDSLRSGFPPRVHSLPAIAPQQASVPGTDANGVAVGVPIQTMRQGGISQLLQRQGSLQQQQNPGLQQQGSLHLQSHPLQDSLQHHAANPKPYAPMTSASFVSSPAALNTPETHALVAQDPFTLASPPNFVDNFSFPGELGSFGDLGLSDAMGVSGPMSWLPGSSLDTSQDALLRPPAA